MMALSKSQHLGSGSIALIAAMESELRHALERLEERSTERLGGWTLHRGRLHGRPVVAVVTGIGMVNAAAAVSVLLASERPSVVLNFGCAGAHRADIHPGDVVVGTGVVAHLSLTILPSGEERYAGFRYQVDDATIVADTIQADQQLITLAKRIAETWNPDRWPWSADTARQPSVHFGVVASADCWTQDPARIGGLHDLHGSLCEDMEAAALAQVCAVYGVPMLAIKDISNNELHVASGPGDSYPSLEAVESEVGARAFALVDQIFRNLDGGPE
jgi:adenosylhomocysteine nucleosidase